MEEIIKDFLEHLYRVSIYIGLEYAGVFMAMGIDLIFGIKKAKAQKIDRTSTALKKTATKGQKYFSPMLCLTLIDVMTCMHVPVPIFTLGWAAYCVWCEFLSVREKSWQKAEMLEAAKTMNVVIKNKDDLAKMVVELMTETKDKDKEGERNENN